MKGFLFAFFLVAGTALTSSCDREVALGPLPDAGANDTAALPYGLPWASGFEDPSLADWQSNTQRHRGRFYTSDGSTIEATRERSHTGGGAAKITLATNGRSLRIAKLLREGPLTESVTFSAWFYLPDAYKVGDYLNLIQLRGRANDDGTGDDISLWDLNARTRGGHLELSVYDHLRQELQPLAPLPALPINQWFRLSLQVVQSTRDLGSIKVWQDDLILLNLTGLATVPTAWLQCNLGALSTDVTPSPAVIYIDDVVLTSP